MTSQARVEKILLVDDDRVTNLMHQRQITRCGLARHVDVATDGYAALEYLDGIASRNEPMPEIVLLDINMPRMNGFEFLAEYASRPPAVRRGQRIIMVSTSTFRSDRARASEDPLVHEFAGKPLRDTDLTRIVSDYCASHGSGAA